jgi:hypothetical protein
LNKEYWWLVTDSIEEPGKSGLISFAVANKYSNYAKLKRVVWKWFRSHLDSKDISSREKVILWCLCERYGNSFSSHDAISYYGQMCGLSSVTMSKGFAVLMDKNIIWCAKQDQRVMLRKLKSGMQHKHFLLVGLGVMLEEESRED